MFYKGSSTRTERATILTIGTPLKSVLDIGSAFRNREKITEPDPQLDLAFNSIENAEASGFQLRTGKVAPRARFMDTEWDVGTGLVWEVSILDATAASLLTAVTIRDERACSFKRAKSVTCFSPAEFAQAIAKNGILESTDILMEWSTNYCDRDQLESLLEEGGLSKAQIMKIIPCRGSCVRIP